MPIQPAAAQRRPRRAALARTGPKTQQADATRGRLIATAIQVLHAHSYQGATVLEVAKAAGVTPGALQHHFGSKAALMMQVLDAIVHASGPDGVAWPAGTGPLGQRCQGLVQALWLRAYHPPRFLAAWAVYFGSAGEPDLRMHLAQQRESLGLALHQRFVQVLPELARAADARALVQLVLSTLRGLGVARLFGPDAEAEDAQLVMLARLIEMHCQSTPVKPRSSRRT